MHSPSKSVFAPAPPCRQDWTPSILSTAAGVGLTVFWALELFVFELCASEPSMTGMRALENFKALAYSSISLLLLHAIVVAVAVAICTRRVLLAIFAMNAVFFAVLIEYARVYFRLLSWPTFRYQFTDLVDVLTLEAGWFSSYTPLAVAVSFFVKCSLVILRGAQAPVRSWRNRIRILFVATFAWGAVVVHGVSELNLVMRVANRQRFLELTNQMARFGYLPVFVADALLRNRANHLEAALRFEAEESSQLSGVEAPLPVTRHIVGVQVESLDWSTFSDSVQVLTPQLREVAARSRVYKVRAMHHNGSADADFAFLTRRHPSLDIVNYRIRDFPYDDSLVSRVERLGYQSTAMHNFKGNFFNRRTAFAKMGFDRMIFSEEILRDYPFQATLRGRPVDGSLLQVSLQLLYESIQPQFHFLITMTSHKPFSFTPSFDQQPIPEPVTDRDRYINSIAYVDFELSKYIRALPSDTLVLIWGDHEWNRIPWYYGPGARSYEYVPFVIYHTDSDLQQSQQTLSSGLAESGSLSMLDVVRYVHSELGSRIQ